MNSQGGIRKPLFVYSYDPPSPDVISEYDPPYPIEITAQSRAIAGEFSFSSLQSDCNIFATKLYNTNCDNQTEGCKTSKEMEFGGLNQPCGHSDQAFKEQTVSYEELNDVTCNNSNVNTISSDENRCSTHENDSKVFDIDSTDQFKSTNNVMINNYESKREQISTEKDEKSSKQLDGENKGNAQSSSQSSIFESTSSCATSYKDGDSSSTYVAPEFSETICPTDSTGEEARCLSPQSTTQSVSSLPSDTITFNVPFDSASSCNDNCTNDDTSVNDGSFNGSRGRSLTSNTQITPSFESEYDSALGSPASRLSPPFTESCTITPFPTDFPTPYSTNPTSSPLPSPVHLDFLSTQQSESSPSTPSTVTSSTMFCVTRKLESLATNANASELASNKGNYVDVNQNNQRESAELDTQNENISNQKNEGRSCFKGLLVSDNSIESIPTENSLSKQLSSDSFSFISITEDTEDMDSKSKTNIYRYRPKTENTNVSELKKNFLNQKNAIYHKMQFLNNKQNPNKTNSEQQKPELENENQQERVLSSPKKEGTFVKIRSPPSPPPRKDLSNRSLPPPLPPPPIEETEEEESKPPVPSLPISLFTNDSLTPPLPPARQYLLIPITPGKGTPLLLTPPTTPTTPHRPNSCRKSSPPPPPPRQSTPIRDLENSISFSPNSLDSGLLQQGTRYLSLTRELTPVPEEGSSPVGHSPSSSESPSPVSHPASKTSSSSSSSTQPNNETRSKKKLLVSSPPPPPLPPKPTALKILPFLNPPPPPPPHPPFHRKGSSSPRTQTPDSNSFDSPREATPESVKSAIRLSPCRRIERSPPNDRIFALSPTDSRKSDQSMAPEPESTPNASSEVPPPAPLSPPPLERKPCMTISPYGKMVINRSDLPLPGPDDEIRKVFVNCKNWGWLHEERDTVAIYTQFRPIIQQGPQCGLVALSMASQVCPSSVSVEHLLEMAKRKEISRHGEMFSSKNMSELSNEALKGVTSVVRKDVFSSPVEVFRTMLEGDLILFPYDAEPNHFPGLNRGRKAHWGLLCGCLIQHKRLKIVPETTALRADSKTDFLWHFRPVKLQTDTDRASSVPPSLIPTSGPVRSSRSVSPYSRTSAESQLAAQKDNLISDLLSVDSWDEGDHNMIVLYRQGKSRNLIYVPLADLCKSNQQLLEYPPSDEYIIHSVEEGLSNQAVVLRKEITGLSDLVGSLQGEVRK